MIMWGIICGAVLGWLLPGSGYGDFGIILGGGLGLLAGLGLQHAIRAEISAANEKLRLQMLELLNSRVGQGEKVADSKSASSRQAAAIELASSFAAPPAAAVAAQPDVAARPQTEPAASAPPAARRVSPPSEPNAADLAFAAAKNWLVGGNTIVRIGLVILFIGLSFLASYAAAAGLFPVELRLAAVAVAGIVLLAVGFGKRQAKPAFALALQGGGVAVIYLTVFAAFRRFDLIAPLPAFGLMIVVCALSCALALLQNSRGLAVAAFAGGFAVPLLISTGSNNSVGLFSYYTVLNLAILFIAYKRSWRVLNIVGFVATFGVATLWGVLKYQPAQYLSSQLFLAAFVLIYVTAAILYARNTPTRLGNTVDSTLMFGTALIGFGLQAGLVRQFKFGAAFSALGFAALYLILAALLMRRGQKNYRLMIESMIAIGLGFVTLAVPLALDMRWTSAVWALEGAGAFWVGMRQARWMPRGFGLALQVVAAGAFLAAIDDNISAWPLANPMFMGAMFIALPAFAIAWWLRAALPHSDSRWAREYVKVEALLCQPLYLYGFLFWCLALILEICRSLPASETGLAAVPVFDTGTRQLLAMLALVASAWLSLLLGRKSNWAVAAWPSRFTLLPLALGFIVQELSGYRILYNPAWAIWLMALGLHYWMLYKNDSQVQGNIAVLKLNRAAHAGSVWLLTLLLADCLWFWIGRADLWQTSWASVVLLVSAIAVLLGLSVWAGKANRSALLSGFKWPLNTHAVAYYWYAALPLTALVFFGALLIALFSSGHTAPLPYLPLLNPTDLTLALALGALLFWRRAIVAAQPMPAGAAWVARKQTLLALAGLAFIVLNTVWLRTVHHFFGVRWDASALFDSFVVQTGYAILWTLLALSLMLLAHRRVQRALWLSGAALLGLVVIKLLLVDLSNVGGAERIVTFIAVGVLMLVVGYFAPLPPKAVAADASTVKEA
ncbi:DUF2339 domain-containing protein [Collimonas sp.]|jgi:uncharacterized membrane protein|uniref:DUF2339 domain-containing protein n=1 Tax=Collimonas sp. TaxID=1963772 RepID=UPI002C5C805F|nr:DUF2339 domain-containing protein [Collimonas sp.]HWW05849.1 DUF2339 domain-containing protein [Collimonas sp.]